MWIHLIKIFRLGLWFLNNKDRIELEVREALAECRGTLHAIQLNIRSGRYPSSADIQDVIKELGDVVDIIDEAVKIANG